MASKGKRKNYFARYYRHLRLSARKNLLFAVFFILPLLILLIVFMDEITGFICDLAVDALAEVFPGIPFYIRSDPFSVLGRVEIPASIP